MTGHLRQTFHLDQKMRKKNFTTFDTKYVVLESDGKNQIKIERLKIIYAWNYVNCACSKNGTELKLINFRSLLKHLTPTNYDSIFEPCRQCNFCFNQKLKMSFLSSRSCFYSNHSNAIQTNVNPMEWDLNCLWQNNHENITEEIFGRTFSEFLT